MLLCITLQTQFFSLIEWRKNDIYLAKQFYINVWIQKDFHENFHQRYNNWCIAEYYSTNSNINKYDSFDKSFIKQTSNENKREKAPEHFWYHFVSQNYTSLNFIFMHHQNILLQWSRWMDFLSFGGIMQAFNLPIRRHQRNFLLT